MRDTLEEVKKVAIQNLNTEQSEVLRYGVVQELNKYTANGSTETFYLLKYEVEKIYFTDIKARCKNQTKAAEKAGLNRGTLRKKYKEYGLL